MQCYSGLACCTRDCVGHQSMSSGSDRLSSRPKAGHWEHGHWEHGYWEHKLLHQCPPVGNLTSIANQNFILSVNTVPAGHCALREHAQTAWVIVSS
ncbi:uncharacterized protein MEPE_00775 [Melanopsichium pennsylvanicum]|uniref:Uncharacterized protein n=1 Tax=Melanopsichium pennsylvanicum TaxID=63383 RepID=A0AAJ4XGP1_9BASI|nr:uncharacterized protein MEPE_00775 [Melanopsichium pennsylvanicum]